MLNLHIHESNQDGKEVITLPKEEFLKLREMAEDYQDLLDLEEAIQRNNGEPGLSLDEAKKRYKLD